MIVTPSIAPRILAVLGAVLLAAVLAVGAVLLESRLLQSIDPRPAIAASFRVGALSIDPVADWRIGPRRALDCALLQSTPPSDAGGIGLRGYSDPRGLAVDCEILRDLAVGDPLAAYEPGLESADAALGRSPLAWFLAQTSMPTLRWMIATLWFALAAIGLAAGWRARQSTGAAGAAAEATSDTGDPVDLLLGPLLAAACLWLIGPSPSAAAPVALLIALASWVAAANLRAAILPAALFGAALALAEYRAPMAVCGLALLLTVAPRRVGFWSALAPILAYTFAALAATAGHGALAVWSHDSSIGALGEALADRLDPARDPLELELLPAVMVDALDSLLPGPRSVALGLLWAVGFGLAFAPALLRASRRDPVPVGRAYAGLTALLPVAIWVIWFGGRSALGAAEGGIIHSWLIVVAVAALLRWLITLAGLDRRGAGMPAAASAL